MEENKIQKENNITKCVQFIDEKRRDSTFNDGNVRNNIYSSSKFQLLYPSQNYSIYAIRTQLLFVYKNQENKKLVFFIDF